MRMIGDDLGYPNLMNPQYSDGMANKLGYNVDSEVDPLLGQSILIGRLHVNTCVCFSIKILPKKLQLKLIGCCS